MSLGAAQLPQEEFDFDTFLSQSEQAPIPLEQQAPAPAPQQGEFIPVQQPQEGPGLVPTGEPAQIAEEFDFDSFLERSKQIASNRQIRIEEPKKSKLKRAGELAVDIGVPLTGALLAPIILPAAVPALGAAAIGGAVFKGAQTAAEALFKGEDVKVIPKSVKEFLFEDTVFGDSIKEAAMIFTGGKVVQKFGPAVGAAAAERLGQPLSYLKPQFQAVSKALQKAGGEFTPAVGRQIGKVFEKIKSTLPNIDQDKFIKDMAAKLENFGLDPISTERAIRKAPEVFTKKNLQGQSMSEETLRKVTKVIQSPKKALRKQYEETIKPLFNEKVDPNSVSEILTNLRADVAESFTPIMSKGKLKYVPKSAGTADATVGKNLAKLDKSLQSAMKNPTLKSLDQVKRDANLFFGKGATREAKAGRLFSELNTNINNVLKKEFPEYAKINEQFSALFDIESALGRKFNEKGVETTLKQLLKKDNTVMRSEVAKLMQSSDEVATVFNDALNERTARNFVSAVKKGGGDVEIAGRFRVPILRTPQRTTSEIGEEILKKSEAGLIKPPTLIAGERATAALGGAGLRETQESLGKKRNEPVIIQGLGTAPR